MPAITVSLSTVLNGVPIMKTTSHLLVLFFVAIVHIALYLIIVNAHEESIKEAQVSALAAPVQQVVDLT
jgi:hypothetical protein